MSTRWTVAGSSWWTCLVAGSALGLSFAANAFPVGERHLQAHTAAAAVRDAHHDDNVRVTLWYPAIAGASEQPLIIGPPNQPLFTPGNAAAQAPFADTKPRPVVLLSHGFGGTARIMAWFGIALARAGYVVIAVDHPGNNGRDDMTIPGALLIWERVGDLSAALAAVQADPDLAAHLDTTRLGVAGFSAGGFTSLAAAGARFDVSRFLTFCQSHADDGVCQPQREFPVTQEQIRAFLARPDMAPWVQHTRAASPIGMVRAAFVMAPGAVQGLDPQSLADIRVPVAIELGDADRVAPAASNGVAAAAMIPGATLRSLPGVAHYDFLAECTAAGDAALPICPTAVPRRQTHAQVITDALAFFARTLGAP